jgi:hypothetical protein
MDMSLKGPRANPEAKSAMLTQTIKTVHTFSGAESEKNMMGVTPLAKTRANA